MTADKQIIIDGVDVSGCTYSQIGIDKKYYCEQDLYDNGTPVFTCDECTDCYYKQLKRKEQECYEYIKELARFQQEVVPKLRKRLRNKEQECEELKENLPNAITRLMGELDQLKAENEELEKELRQKKMTILMNNDHYFEVDQENKKLKQTLAEIKEIAKPYQKDIDKICGNCRRYDGCHACCMDTLNNYEYRTGTTKACDKFIELKDFDINKLANQILQEISECEGNNGK